MIYILVAFEILAGLVVWVFLCAAFIFFNDREVRRHHPTVWQVCVEQLVGPVWVSGRVYHRLRV